MTIPEHLPICIGATAYGLVVLLFCLYMYIISTPEKKDGLFRKCSKWLLRMCHLYRGA